MKRSVFAMMATAWLSLCVAAAGCNSRPAATTLNRPATTAPAAVAAVATAPATTAPVATATATTSPAPAQAPAPVEIDAREALAYLASDKLEGRGIGTSGLDLAANYIAEQFAAIGLRPPAGQKDFFQEFEMTTSTEVGAATALRVGDRAFEPKTDFSPVAFSAEGDFAGGVVFAGYGISHDEHHYDDYAEINVRNRVVLAMRYEPHDEKGNSRFESDGWSEAAAIVEKARQAHERGATGLLLVTPPVHHEGEETLLGLARRSPGDIPPIPVMHVKFTVAEELLRRGGGPELNTLQNRIDKAAKPVSFALADVDVSGEVDIEHQLATVKNVIGILPGVQRDEYVVVGAHYDHLGRGGIGSFVRNQIHNGADDNASGTVALLMLASRLSAGETPPRSIVFAAFTGEEEGLVGSSRFVNHPPVLLSQTVAMLNLDMVGRIRPPRESEPRQEPQAGAMRPATTAPSPHATGAAAATKPAPHGDPHATTAPVSNDPVLYVGGSGTAKAFDRIVQSADARSPLQVRDMGRGGLGPSDHMSFAQRKIPVLFFFSGLHSDYHRPTDDADKINYQGIEQVVDFVSDVIRQVAAMEKQQYVDAADASSMRVGVSSRGGPRVTLGVVPDYSALAEGQGVRIGGTSPGTPAAAAGLKAGDVLVQFDQHKLGSLQDLSDRLARSKPGQKVMIKLLRNGQPVEIEITLAERKR